ncbi:hypothetical protein D3C87_1999500 [compost metagenome]
MCRETPPAVPVERLNSLVQPHLSKLFANLFCAVKGTDSGVHGLAVHHHDMAFFHGIKLTDRGIAFQEFDFFFRVIQNPTVTIEA